MNRLLKALRPALLASALTAQSVAAMPMADLGDEGIALRIHGCHQNWRQSERGWHRHGPKCETREGLANRTKQRGKGDRARAAI